MHKSRLTAFGIDCQGDDLDGAAAFWSAALGMRTTALGPGEESYVALTGGRHGLSVEVQQVEHDSRVHLDIETDDIPAEVERLEQLGATVVDRLERWVVMQAPSGQRFCVVRVQRPGFPDNAMAWD